MKPESKNLLLYIGKCLTGCLIIFLLAWIFDFPDVTWAIISVMLVLTPESSEAVPLAVTRIKANLIGGLASFLCLIFFPANSITITVVIVISILACYFLKLMAGSRAAIAAVIIIMMHGIEYSELSFWRITIERIIAVIVGCVLGLGITVAFHREFFRKKFDRGKAEEA